MKKLAFYLPQLVLIIGTRVLLGGGTAILLTEKMDRKQRRVLGFTLGRIGLLTTIPLAMEVLIQNRAGENKMIKRVVP